MNLYLIGYRCTGKTSVGNLLARQLGRRFYDADADAVERCGMTIAQMVEKNGWPAFRRLEKETIARLSRKTDGVVATGGGAILDPANVFAMKKSGKIVWLTAEIGTIRSRMAGDEATADLRPALKKGRSSGIPDNQNKDKIGDEIRYEMGDEIRDEIEETLKERLPLYKDAADMEIDTDLLPPEAVADRILKWLKDTEKEA